MFRRLVIALCFAMIVVTGATAQEKGSAVNLNFTGAFTSGNQGLPSGNASYVATFEQSFSKRDAVELNYGYLEQQKYGLRDGSAFVQSNMHEMTAAYVMKFPRGKLVPFVKMGGGAVLFKPSSNSSEYLLPSGGVPTSQVHATLLYGAGADYNVTKNLAFRVQYRGLLFRAPDFHTADLYLQPTAHIAEPSVGVVFHF